MKKYASLIAAILFVWSYAGAQTRHAVYSIGFYNVENLFDTERDETINDVDFTPEGSYNWTEDKYREKLSNMAYVLSRLGKETTTAGVAAVGLAEVENRRVLEDLVATGDLAEMGWDIVHYDSPDRRGVDVALLYNPRLFTVISSKPYKYVHPDMPDYVTRDQLLVSGIMGGELIHLIVNHWPSRFGGKTSNTYREVAAELTKHIADSLYNADINSKIIIMGDLNDDPIDSSVKVVLGAKRKESEVKPGGLFNTTWSFFDKGIGTLTYQGKWNLFDQIIISESLLGKDRSTLKFWKTEIFNRDFLIEKQGRYKGSPKRTFSGNTFINGYSDHLPVIVYLAKEISD
ncbi:MAG: endonuclease/exonuclease/phosphatase family protein [Rikenellaceae bacterium]|nr:endonuclease/exonuclease/phosphatase family protein [Rikenellaceae bacterium]